MTPRVAAANPLTALGAALLITLVLLVTGLDLRAASAAVVVECVAAAFAGVPAPRLGRRALPVVVFALLLGVTIGLYGAPSGVVHLRAGPILVTGGSLALAVATAVRLVAITLPAVVLFTDLDPTRLADALGQRLRVPARIVLSALAALRLVEEFGDDRRSLAAARRARGLGGGPAALPGQVFGMLVVALRHASDLATAMEARGFGAPVRRTWLRPSRFGVMDAVVAACAALVCTAAVVAPVLSHVA